MKSTKVCVKNSSAKALLICGFLSEIMDDIKTECQKYGEVLEVKIPRPTGGSRQSNGVGKIFVKFDKPESAGKALRALAGRKFADRTVVTTFFSEVCFIFLTRSLSLTKYRKILRWLPGKLPPFLRCHVFVRKHFIACLLYR
jgi:hypothetical protein